MILVDTSIWADHLRRADKALSVRLEAGTVLMHPFVIGELAMGHLPKRAAILSGLQKLPAAVVASASEVLGLIDRAELAGSGVGYIDAHLLASACLSGARLATRDRRLQAVAERLGLLARLD